MKKFFPLCFVFVFLFSINASAEKIVMAVMDDFTPFQYEENNQAVGIDADMIREACKRLGIELELKVMPWKRALVNAEKGRVSGMLTALYTKERAGFLYFTKEGVHTQKNIIMAKKGSGLKIKSLDDLKGKGIGVIRNFSYGPDFDNYQGLNKVVCDNQKEMIRILERGRIDLAVGSEKPFIFNSRQLKFHDRFEVAHVITEYQVFTVFSKKATGERGEQLAKDFDDVYRKIKKEGLDQKFIDKYLK